MSEPFNMTELKKLEALHAKANPKTGMVSVDGLVLNLKRWLRNKHGDRVRRGKHYMALRIACYGRHNVESKRRFNRGRMAI